MNEELNKALEQISDDHIYEAACHRRSRKAWWIGSIAAALAVIICWCAIWGQLGGTVRPVIMGTEPADISNAGKPQSPSTLQLSNLVAAPAYPQMALCPVYEDYNNYKEYDKAYNSWRTSQLEQYDQPAGYADSLVNFWTKSVPTFLSGEGNRAYSPVNVYLALAMLAETTGGNSHQEILDLLGANSIEELRTQASHVWNAHYSDDGKTTSLLANSLWLDEAYTFNKGTVQELADSYYASVFHGDLGTDESNDQLRKWLNAQTGNLLTEQAKNTKLSEACVFALCSTVYFAADWEDGFAEKDTAEGLFHCKDQNLTTQFMNKTILIGTYYWGEDFGAVYLRLSSGGMWLILPDEDKRVEDVLAGSEYLQLTLDPANWKNQKTLMINLSLPKFDISSQADLVEGMKALGLRDIFNYTKSDFTPMTNADELYVGQIDHAVRVAVDEEGLIAAAYTVISADCGGAPQIPDDKIDFILDRPFLFVVSSHDNLPLFTGVVAQP